MHEIAKHCYRLNTPSAVAELVGNEVVAINLDTGAYYGMPGVSSGIWPLVVDGITVREIVNAVCCHFSGSREEIKTHVFEFIQQLLEEELIASDSETSKTKDLPPPSFPGSENNPRDTEFKIPKLQKYTDMKEFLLVDPIHEVDVTNWPAPETRKDTKFPSNKTS